MAFLRGVFFISLFSFISFILLFLYSLFSIYLDRRNLDRDLEGYQSKHHPLATALFVKITQSSISLSKKHLQY